MTTRFLAPGSGDEAADASRFLSRVGYIVLALGAPVSVVLHQLAIFVVFAIGVALLLFAWLLDPEVGVFDRLRRAFSAPVLWVPVALLAWAVVTIAWAPYPATALQHALKLALFAIAGTIALAPPHENARATDLYLFPIGVVLGIVGMMGRGLGEYLAGTPDAGRISSGGLALAVLLFPALGALAARGRNGLARLLLILAVGLAYLLGEARLTIGLFAGFLALSLCLSDLRRTLKELSWLAATIIVFAPLVPALAPTVAKWVFHAKLAALPAPYPALSVAADIFTHDKIRLITGNGFATIRRSVEVGILPAQTPRGLVFEIWYELGVVGALLFAAGAWLGFRAMLRAPARLAPYLAAALTCNIALAFLNVDFYDMRWITLVAVGAICADIAARSQYRTTRPSAANLAHL